MPIVVNLNVMLARRKMRSKELAERIGITEQNVSLLKSGRVKGIRFETLARICAALDCQPGDSYDVEVSFRGEIQRDALFRRQAQIERALRTIEPRVDHRVELERDAELLLREAPLPRRAAAKPRFQTL